MLYLLKVIVLGGGLALLPAQAGEALLNVETHCDGSNELAPMDISPIDDPVVKK